MRQASEFSCGTASTRSGRGFSWASSTTSPALKRRIAWATLVPVLRTGLAARLSGSTLSNEVRVFGIELSVAGPDPDVLAVWLDGEQDATRTRAKNPTIP